MRIAILSDTHSRHETVKEALQQIDAVGVDLILHCGDIEDEDTVYLFSAKTHFVYGNCDSERDKLRQAIALIGGALHDPFGELELAGVKIAFLHSDNHRLFKQLENSDKYDYLFYGHTHLAHEHRTGRTRVINPGALHRASPKGFIILDLPAGTVNTFAV